MCMYVCEQATKQFFQDHKDQEYVFVYKVLKSSLHGLQTPFSPIIVQRGGRIIAKDPVDNYKKLPKFYFSIFGRLFGRGKYYCTSQGVHALISREAVIKFLNEEHMSMMIRVGFNLCVVRCKVPLSDVIAVSEHGKIVVKKLDIPNEIGSSNSFAVDKSYMHDILDKYVHVFTC